MQYLTCIISGILHNELTLHYTFALHYIHLNSTIHLYSIVNSVFLRIPRTPSGSPEQKAVSAERPFHGPAGGQKRDNGQRRYHREQPDRCPRAEVSGRWRHHRRMWRHRYRRTLPGTDSVRSEQARQTDALCESTALVPRQLQETRHWCLDRSKKHGIGA